jgi:Rieske Fe-S protein
LSFENLSRLWHFRLSNFLIFSTMDGFVVKKPRVKEVEVSSLEVFKPAPRIAPVEFVVKHDDIEELDDDRDEFLNDEWERKAEKRKEHRKEPYFLVFLLTSFKGRRGKRWRTHQRLSLSISRRNNQRSDVLIFFFFFSNFFCLVESRCLIWRVMSVPVETMPSHEAIFGSSELSHFDWDRLLEDDPSPRPTSEVVKTSVEPMFEVVEASPPSRDFSVIPKKIDPDHSVLDLNVPMDPIGVAVQVEAPCALFSQVPNLELQPFDSGSHFLIEPMSLEIEAAVVSPVVPSDPADFSDASVSLFRKKEHVKLKSVLGSNWAPLADGGRKAPTQRVFTPKKRAHSDLEESGATEKRGRGRRRIHPIKPARDPNAPPKKRGRRSKAEIEAQQKMEKDSVAADLPVVGIAVAPVRSPPKSTSRLAVPTGMDPEVWKKKGQERKISWLKRHNHVVPTEVAAPVGFCFEEIQPVQQPSVVAAATFHVVEEERGEREKTCQAWHQSPIIPARDPNAPPRKRDRVEIEEEKDSVAADLPVVGIAVAPVRSPPKSTSRLAVPTGMDPEVWKKKSQERKISWLKRHNHVVPTEVAAPVGFCFEEIQPIQQSSVQVSYGTNEKKGRGRPRIHPIKPARDPNAPPKKRGRRSKAEIEAQQKMEKDSVAADLPVVGVAVAPVRSPPKSASRLAVPTGMDPEVWKKKSQDRKISWLKRLEEESSTSETDSSDSEDDFCAICKSHGNGEVLLLCEICSASCHLGCCNPPLLSVPDGAWFCSSHGDTAPSAATAMDDQTVASKEMRRSAAIRPLQLEAPICSFLSVLWFFFADSGSIREGGVEPSQVPSGCVARREEARGGSS